jgi:FG-GAP-like repeat
MKFRTLAFFSAMTLFAALGITAQTSAQGTTFAPAIAYGSGGYEPGSVAVGDVNGDGKPDLVVANFCASQVGGGCPNGDNGTVGVLLGNGDGAFQAAVTYSSGGWGSVSVVVADVNGDGKLDLLVTNSCPEYNSECPLATNSTVGVLLGNGDGTFKPAVTYASGGFDPSSVAVADVNGDGKPDLVVANGCIPQPQRTCGGYVSVLLGNGDGTFQPAVTYASGGIIPHSVAVADVNRDGKPDLLVANQCLLAAGGGCPNGMNGGVSVLLGNGDGTFRPAVSYDSGGLYTNSVAVADVNRDGKPDLAVANLENGSVSVLLGNGDGTFQPAVSYSSFGHQQPLSVAVADVNGDDNPDLLVLAVFSVSVLLGNGDGTFQPAVSYDLASGSVGPLAVADVNGDGKPDLVVANFCARQVGGCPNGTVSVLINITPSPYKAFVQQPINSDRSSIFNAKRGVIPVKFTLTQNGMQTCALPAATISVTRTAGGKLGAIDEASFLSPADNGSNFRIDATACQYVYILAAQSLGVGTYRIDISINGQVVGSAVFALN